MGIAIGILSLRGTEPDTHLGVTYPPQLQRTHVSKNILAT